MINRIHNAKIKPTLEMPRQFPDTIPQKNGNGIQTIPTIYWENVAMADLPYHNNPTLRKQWESVQPILNRGGFIAGGFMVDSWLGNVPKDIDIFFPDSLAMKRVLEWAHRSGYTVTESHIQDLENGKMQIVLNHYDDSYIPLNIVNVEYRCSVESFMAWFDLTICQIGLSFSPIYGHRIHRLGYWEGAAERKIMHYNIITHWMTTKKRVLKYAIKGFTLEDGIGTIEIGNGVTKFY